MLDFWANVVNNPDAIEICGIVVVLSVPVIACCWYMREKHRDECKLKQSMIDRGMSADEIERVLRAKSTGQKKKSTGARHLEAQI